MIGERPALLDFQTNAVDALLERFEDPNQKQDLILSAPTGAGKTMILASFAEQYLHEVDPHTAFIWLTPGAGDLEQQSKQKTEGMFPEIKTQDLEEVLREGFSAGSISFINWELLVGKKKLATRPGEQPNIYDRIAEAKRQETSFVVFVDEEHSHDTEGARFFLDSLAAHRIVRASATPRLRSNADVVQVPEADVVAAGLISKAIYVNPGLTTDVAIGDEYDVLLRLAEGRRLAVQREYDKRGIKVRPLVLIQFPSGQPDVVESVEKKLAELGYTYANGAAAKWFSGDRQGNLDGIEANNAQPVYLLMKQAVSTGWDCPRAKILVKLRENMSEQFEVQTVGRIRRMPEARHYGDDNLDCCFVYTLDEDFRSELISSYKNSYTTKTLFLKPEARNFYLIKQMRDRDSGTVNERAVLDRLRRGFVDMYRLDEDLTRNRDRLEAAGYILDDCIHKRIMQGRFVSAAALQNSDTNASARIAVNTHDYSRKLMHSVDKVKVEAHVSYSAMRTILERLFQGNRKTKAKAILDLTKKELYAFVINNEQRIRDDVRAIAAQSFDGFQMGLSLQPKEQRFMIPESDEFRFIADVTGRILQTNAYEGYMADCMAVRSTPERLFEEMIERRAHSISWLYKNRDSGSEYFSIVYRDGLSNEHLFYPDYIVRFSNGEVWIIETKGGEQNSKDKNVDPQAPNKFAALKKYVEDMNRRDPGTSLRWGFVRDRNGSLFINNEEYVDSLDDPRWRLAEQALPG